MEVDFTKLLEQKNAGIFAPLFSMRSLSDWGIGDFRSLENWIKWAHKNKTKIVQILSINEMPKDSTSPYSCISAFAIDPMYLSIEDIDEVKSSKKIKELIASKKIQNIVSILNKNSVVDYKAVRQVKNKFFDLAFDSFFKTHWVKNTKRALGLKHFIEKNKNWLYHYAIFRTAKDVYNNRSWTHWDVLIRACDTSALEKFNSRHCHKILFYKYLQWLCYLQIKKAKELARSLKILLFGDVPFILNQESADVWANQDIFDISTEIGSPPDEFSKSGQKWGLPAYNWWSMKAGNFQWWRLRIKYISQFFDLFRLDHVVGFFRTWTICRHKKEGCFDLEGENQQKQRGRDFLSVILEEAKNSYPIAEDLGVIPDFVRETLQDLKIPGYKVVRWECEKDKFRALQSYLAISLATTSTHDTSTFKKWWSLLEHQKRDSFWHTLTGKKDPAPKFSMDVHKEIIKGLMQSNSCFLVLPLQDLFAIDGRINTPGTLSDDNWIYRFPCAVEEIYKYEKFTEILKFYNEVIVSTSRDLKS